MSLEFKQTINKCINNCPDLIPQLLIAPSHWHGLPPWSKHFCGHSIIAVAVLTFFRWILKEIPLRFCAYPVHFQNVIPTTLSSERDRIFLKLNGFLQLFDSVIYRFSWLKKYLIIVFIDAEKQCIVIHASKHCNVIRRLKGWFGYCINLNLQVFWTFPMDVTY